VSSGHIFQYEDKKQVTWFCNK